MARHRVLMPVAFYDLHRLRWDYSFPRSPRGEPCRPTRKYLSLGKERINMTRWDKVEFIYGGGLVRNSYAFNQQLISWRAFVNYRQVGDIRKDKVYIYRSAEKSVENVISNVWRPRLLGLPRHVRILISKWLLESRMRQLTYLLTYLLHGAESFLRS